jgi:hypothetical protein
MSGGNKMIRTRKLFALLVLNYSTRLIPDGIAS